MATTKCFDCKKEISQSANKCPHCGSTVPIRDIWAYFGKNKIRTIGRKGKRG